jgi:hypothetical protein
MICSICTVLAYSEPRLADSICGYFRGRNTENSVLGELNRFRALHGVSRFCSPVSHFMQGKKERPESRARKIRSPFFLEEFPQVLVVHLVVELHFGCLDVRAQQARAAVG